MLKKHILLIVIIFCFSFYNYAQLCEGSLGDPIVEIDFGSGTGRGTALGSTITAFNYVGTGTLDEGEYTIFNTTSCLKENPWHITGDHTGNANGYMMVINSAVLANEGIFYTKTVDGLCSDTTYEFSAWVMNMMNPANGTDEHNPNITFRVSDTNGNLLGSYNTGNIPQTSSPTWIQYGFFFNLDSDTEVIITILNSAASGRGNDIVLDDIAFRPCGPTITNSIDGNNISSINACKDETINYTLETTLSSGYSDPRYQWQYSNDNGMTWIDIIGETTQNLLVTDTSTPQTFLYRAAIANGDNINSLSCRIVSDEFTVMIIEKPAPLIGEIQQTFCTTQNATVSTIEVNGNSVWYENLSTKNPLPSDYNLIHGVTYYGAQQNNTGCESDFRLGVLVDIISPTLIINNVSTDVCDNLNDDNEFIDLTTYETDITTCSDCLFSYFLSQADAEVYSEDNKISAPTHFNWSLETSVIYIRIDSSDKCYQIAELSINLIKTPTILISDSIGICEGENDVTIDAGFGFYSYSWSTGETTQIITVSKKNLGNHSLTVTKDYGMYICSSTKYFEVTLSNTAIISHIDIKDWTDNDNSITINLSHLSLGNYEYSLDDITYQDSNTFTTLNYGEHTVYVRDKNGCDTINKKVYILNAPKFFTPNADGYNDTWSIENTEIIEPTMTISIYDRYGKLIKFLDAKSSWDGTCNGTNMPTSDYWFLVTRANNSQHTGHFTLKR